MYTGMLWKTQHSEQAADRSFGTLVTFLDQPRRSLEDQIAEVASVVSRYMLILLLCTCRHFNSKI